MVEVMLGTGPRRGSKVLCGRACSYAGEEEGGVPREVRQWGWNQALASSHYGAGDPSRCTFWCAIALGALVQGCSIEFVSFVKKATKFLWVLRAVAHSRHLNIVVF